MAVTLNSLWKGIALAIPFCLLITSQVLAQFSDVEILWEYSLAKGIQFNVSEKLKSEGTWIVTLKGKEISILGRFEKSPKSFSFFPVLPFTPGLDYQIKVSGKVAYEFSVPYQKNAKGTAVTNIFPSATLIPANLLKIHIYFSRSMSEGHSKDYIHVIDDKGDTLNNVFLDLQPELWNEDRSGLTLWLDPGRIKRDLQPNLKLGPLLKINSNYRIVVSKLWKDKFGTKLTDNFTKSYTVVHEDREKPALELWDLSYPVAKTRGALILDFQESIDYELASNAIQIFKDEQVFHGNVTLNSNESQWRFKPTEPWLPGKYKLIIETRLEDLAGNNLNRLFDRDLERDAGDISESKYAEMSFSISEGSVP